jgi:mRNA capping enzyme, catalytic domain
MSNYIFVKILEFDGLIQLFAKQGNTLIDGEMVRHYQTKRAVFMMFDLLRVNGNFFGNLTLSQRLGPMSTEVTHLYHCIQVIGIVDSN